MRLTSDPASEIQPSFSPQGDKVAYATNRSGSWDIWVVGVDGSNPTRLTNSASNDMHPSWSPGGKYIVYCSFGPRSQQWELWILDVESPSMKKWVGYGLFPEWCPNGQTPKIAFQLARYRGSQWFSIWTVDFIDGEAKFPTEIISNINHACICPSWSSDGSQLTYSTVNGSSYDNVKPVVPNVSGEDVWIIDIDGRNNLRLTHGDAVNFSPTWDPEGRVYFCSDRKGVNNIWSIKPHQADFTPATAVEISQKKQNKIQAN
jgi:TolB protein